MTSSFVGQTVPRTAITTFWTDAGLLSFKHGVLRILGCLISPFRLQPNACCLCAQTYLAVVPFHPSLTMISTCRSSISHDDVNQAFSQPFTMIPTCRFRSHHKVVGPSLILQRRLRTPTRYLATCSSHAFVHCLLRQVFRA